MSFRWGIWGTGAISAKFVAGLRSVPGARVAMVASRDAARAEGFARPHRAAALGGYDAAAFQGQVDVVYIATPTGLHSDHARACLEAGIPVLVEKPFAATTAQAGAIAATAQRNGVFAMEALWTRMLPATRALAAQVQRGDIGRVVALQGSFAIANASDSRRALFDRALGGGALRQYSVYPLALAQLVAGRARRITATGSRTMSGVDASVMIEVEYESGAHGQYFASLETEAANDFTVLGEHGRVALTGPIFRPAGLRVARFVPRQAEQGGSHRSSHSLKARLRGHPLADRAVQWLQHCAPKPGRAIAHPFDGNGYGHEAAEAMRCIAAGLTESPLMPHADSLELAELIDRADAQVTG